MIRFYRGFHRICHLESRWFKRMTSYERRLATNDVFECSVLSPVLFLLDVSDVFVVFSSGVPERFADDKQIACTFCPEALEFTNNNITQDFVSLNSRAKADDEILRQELQHQQVWMRCTPRDLKHGEKSSPLTVQLSTRGYITLARCTSPNIPQRTLQ